MAQVPDITSKLCPGISSERLTLANVYVQGEVQKLIFKQLIDGEGFTEPVEFIDCNGERVQAVFALSMYLADWVEQWAIAFITSYRCCLCVLSREEMAEVLYIYIYIHIYIYKYIHR